MHVDELKKWLDQLKGWQSVSDHIALNSMVRHIILTYYLPFGLPLSSGKGFVNTGKEKVRIELEVKQKTPIQSREKDEIPVPAITLSPSMRIWNDRFGQNNYTSIRFIFEIVPEKELQKLPDEEFVQKSVQVVNQILEGCRIVSDKFLPRDFVRIDIAGYNIDYFDSQGKSVFSTGSFGGGGKVTSNELLNETQLKEFDHILKNNIRLSLENELILNAKDYLLFENYRMACIEIQSAVETVLSKKIRNHFEKSLDKESLNKILRKGWDDLKPYLKQSTNEQITQTTECLNWREQCANVRHSVIHQQYIPSKIQAENAIKSGEMFIQLLNSI